MPASPVPITSVAQVIARMGFFADPVFMTHLDVTFASLYFGAVDAAGDPAAVRWPDGRLPSSGPHRGSSRSSSRSQA